MRDKLPGFSPDPESTMYTDEPRDPDPAVPSATVIPLRPARWRPLRLLVATAISSLALGYVFLRPVPQTITVAQAQRLEEEWKAFSTFRTQNLVVDDTSVLTGHASVQDLSLAPSSNAGRAAFHTVINNYAPTGWATHTLFNIEGADDPGTLVTGLSSTGISLGDVRTICNYNGPNDASSVAFANMSTSSTAGNRVWCPGGGDTVSGFIATNCKLGPDTCVDLVYGAPSVDDPTLHAWMPKGLQNRFETAIISKLQLYPTITPALITGTVNDWLPVNAGGASSEHYTCDTNTSDAGVPCNIDTSAGTLLSTSLIQIQTVDATATSITGIKYTSGPEGDLGPVLVLCNEGPGVVTLKNTDGGSSLIDQFGFTAASAGVADVVLSPGGFCAWVYHLRATGRWIQLGHYDAEFQNPQVTVRHDLAVFGTVETFGNNIFNLNVLDKGDLYIGFGGAATQIAQVTAAPTVNHGGLNSESSNFIGEVTSIGANTSVQFTFGAGGFSTIAHCFISAISGTSAFTVSTTKTGPLVSCFSLTTGVAANCPDFQYQCWGK